VLPAGADLPPIGPVALAPAQQRADPGLTETDIDQALGTARSEGRSWARLSGQQVQARVWERDQAPQVVRAWFNGIGPDVVLVELVHPPSDLAVEELVDRWGPQTRSGRRDGWSRVDAPSWCGGVGAQPSRCATNRRRA
jgi:hypothetical protein